jgi:hypothetical protein
VVEGTSEIQRTIIARALLDGQFDWATGGNSGYAADPGAFTPTEGDRA